MADVFISYKLERRSHAERLAVILQAHGYDVWWDHRLLPGDKFRKEIEAQIDNAKAVVVLWCKRSVESEFVIDEADHARKSQKLLQVVIESVIPPLGFRSVDQRLDLAGWPGNADHEGIEALLQPIALLVGREPRRPKDLIKALAVSLRSLPGLTVSSDATIEEDDEDNTGVSRHTSNSEQEKEREHTYFKLCETPDDYENYLNRYPKGHFAELARSKIAASDRNWITNLGLDDTDWGLLSREALLQKVGPRGSRAELEPRARRGVLQATTLLAMAANQANDPEEAARLYERASNRAFPRAQLGYGIMLIKGEGIEKNEVAGLELVRAASDRGLPLAQALLAILLNEGKIVGPDEQEAAQLFRLAAERGHPLSQYQFGRALELGRGVPKDLESAYSWFRKSAEQDYVLAQNATGRLLRDGRGVQKDPAQAVGWFNKAAEGGNLNAQNNLGRLLKTGTGITKDEARALMWFRKAAEGGLASAQFNLGTMLEKGLATPANIDEAIEWYRKAAEQGHKSAGGALRRLGIALTEAAP
jgi:TPR repeat protein